MMRCLQRLCSLVSIFFGYLLLSLVQAGAQTSPDRCNDILRQDIFNKIKSSTQTSQDLQHYYTDYIYSLSDTQAWDEYKRAWESILQQGTSGGANFQYALIKAGFDFTHSYDRQLSESEFRASFKSARDEYRSGSSSSSVSNTSYISMYESTIRDSRTIDAWENCMNRGAQTEIIAYGFRDPGDRPYMAVVWIPGPISNLYPSISIRVNATDPAVIVEGVKSGTVLGSGTGASFPISVRAGARTCAYYNGFTLLINGTVRRGEEVIRSYRAEAIIPSLPRARGECPFGTPPPATGPIDAAYHSRTLSGTVTFNYSNNNGRFFLGEGDLLFETDFTKRSDTSIYVTNDSDSVEAIALARGVAYIDRIKDASVYDFSSRVRAPQLAEIVIWRNVAGNYAATKIVDLKDDTRGDDHDEVTFEYRIIRGATGFRQ